MTRRDFIAAASWLGLMYSSFARSAPLPGPHSIPGASPLEGSTTPYDTISPAVVADAKTVRFFFSYECPHCRSYHNGLMQWGKTLPGSIQFQATPLITHDGESLIMSVYGRIIGSMIDPQVLPMYDLVIYQKTQGDGQGGGKNIDVDDVLSALIEAGIDPAKLQSFIAKSRLLALAQAKIPDHSKAIEAYAIKSTPSVSIFGKYIVTPDHALGNPTQYLALLNGMVSRAMNGKV